MFIQCDTCNVWQHGGCVGIWADEEAPDSKSRCMARLNDRLLLREV